MKVSRLNIPYKRCLGAFHMEVFCLSWSQWDKKNSHEIWIWLVVSTPLKNMSSSVGIILPNIWKNKKCSKPPTRNVMWSLVAFTERHGFSSTDLLKKQIPRNDHNLEALRRSHISNSFWWHQTHTPNTHKKKTIIIANKPRLTLVHGFNQRQWNLV